MTQRFEPWGFAERSARPDCIRHVRFSAADTAKDQNMIAEIKAVCIKKRFIPLLSM